MTSKLKVNLINDAGDNNLITSDGSGSVTLGTAFPAVGKIGQVVSTEFTSTASSSSATPADVSGFSATITPTSTSSKVLVHVNVMFGFANDAYPYILVKRNGTSIGVGASASGVQVNTFLSGTGTSTSVTQFRSDNASKMFLDSPNSTSALTFQVQLASPYASLVGYINRQGSTADANYIQRPASTITLMEVLP